MTLPCSSGQKLCRCRLDGMDHCATINLLGANGKGLSAKCDQADLPLVQEWDWFLSRDGYALGRNEYGHRIMMHRLILPAPKGFVTDHFNGNRLDNRRSNLRAVSLSKNGLNPNNRRKESSGPFRNVYTRGDRFVGRFTYQGKEVYCGVHDNEIEALIAVNSERGKRGLDLILIF